MKDLEKVLSSHFTNPSANALPDVSKDCYLRVNTRQDGYHSIDDGGKLYVIKQDGADYGIYHVHSYKYDAVLRGGKHEPTKVDSYYVDDVPVVMSDGENVYFDARDTTSPYDIVERVNTYKRAKDSEILYDVLQAFCAYAYSVYRFTEGYESLVKPPIEIGEYDNYDETHASGNAGSTPSGSAGSTGSTGSTGSNGSNPADSNGSTSQPSTGSQPSGNQTSNGSQGK